MKKKGFTLIELLAVIVILAVIALIAVPQILKVLNEARRGAAEDSVNGIAESAESYVADLLLANSGNYPNQELEFECDGEKCGLTSSIKTELTTAGINYKDNLQIKGKIPTSGTVKISANGKNIMSTDLEINGYTCYYFNGKADCYNGVLPDGYEAVEYIENNGTQYIDTGFSPDTNTKVEYKVKFSTEQTAINCPLIGSRVGVYNPNRFLVIAYQSVTYGRYAFGLSETAFILNLNNTYTGVLDTKNSYTNINGTNYTLSKENFSKSQDNNIYLFATSGYGTTLYNAKGRIYYCNIYDNDVIVRYLIPCYRKSDNVAGMYDLVNKQFYTSEGTGSFVIPE